MAVYYFVGHTGLGSVPLAEKLQSPVLEELVKRAGLSRKPKGNMRLTLLEQEYDVLVKVHDSFGESAFTLKRKRAGAAVK